MLVTFDSNVWRPAGDPSRFPNDPMYSAFKKINEALRVDQVEGRLSETIFTLEGIVRSDRKAFIGGYEPDIKIVEEQMPDGRLSVNFSIGPDRFAHPGSNTYLRSHLGDALALGFKLMRCYRIGGIINIDMNEDWYVKVSTGSADISAKFGEVGRRIEAAGAGIAWIRAIGIRYARSGEHWTDGLRNAPASEDNAIASAVAEWADGDSVAAHFAYGNHYFCTRDLARTSGRNSVFAETNRRWLEVEYGLKLVTPEELASLV